jgi:hypothetical protein
MNAEHFAKIRRLLEEAKAAKDHRLVMVWTREIKVLAARHIRTN